MTPAYQIAALKPEEQALLVETIESEQATPSVSQAQRMNKVKPVRGAERGHHAHHHAGGEEAGGR